MGGAIRGHEKTETVERKMKKVQVVKEVVKAELSDEVEAGVNAGIKKVVHAVGKLELEADELLEQVKDMETAESVIGRVQKVTAPGITEEVRVEPKVKVEEAACKEPKDVPKEDLFTEKFYSSLNGDVHVSNERTV